MDFRSSGVIICAVHPPDTASIWKKIQLVGKDLQFALGTRTADFTQFESQNNMEE